MSTRLWKCRNPRCQIRHGEILGRLTANGTLDLFHEVRHVRIDLDSRQVIVKCPQCGTERMFQGGKIYFNPMVE